MQPNVERFLEWVHALMNNVGIIHIAIGTTALFACIIAYRLGYGSAVSKLLNEIHSREMSLIKSEGLLSQREYSLTQNSNKLQADIKDFEEARLRRIDDRVLELFDKKRIELQSEFESKQEELRERYRTERDKLRNDCAAKEKTLLDAKELAVIAEKQFREEYEKWVRNNRPVINNESEIELSPEQMLAFFYVTNTKKNLFIQGQAGTGKSTLVRFLKMRCKKKVVFASPTGAAAYIIGGSTIHSVFGIEPKDFIDIKKLNPVLIRSSTASLLKEAELVVIDETSMVNPNILDVIDWTAKAVRENKSPFGGLQIALIGDLFQLPPVITDSVKEIFETIYGYENAYFLIPLLSRMEILPPSF